ncbi:acetyl-CoA carboxylase biotin carboxyl carrier protein [bacterium]|nr:acetyl-CoA carboxylase biotin carboxyl carrier protein [bacterium]MBU1636317.1 acetyl-CoA carboxylase biotin carboxyl carrier protein [bacterium]
MDLPEIQKLIRIIEKSPITVFELEDKDLKIKISKNGSHSPVVQTVMSSPIPASLSAPSYSAATAAEAPAAAEKAPVVSKNIVEIKAPMVGTFYRAPSPDADPYVNVGDRVEPNRVLCIIEAMKLMNEVEAELSGRIVEACVENAEPVEYGQVLFRVDITG